MEKYSILYIDDEERNLRVFRSTFKRSYRIQLACSAKEGLEYLQEESFDMLITDQRMPNMTGIDLLRHIKNDFPDMIRIILTGYSDTSVIISALNECNLYRYLTKPWNQEDMDMTLRNAFKSYALEKENRKLVQELKDTNQELEKTVQKRTLQLQKKNQRLQSFAQIVSHDLRNPIGNLYSLFEMMNDEALSQEDKNDLFDLARISVNRLTEIITDLSEAIKLTSASDAQSEQIDFQVIFQNVIDENYLEIQKLDAKIYTDFAIASVYYPKIYLRSIFHNFITNALKYSHPDRKPELQIKTSMENERAVLQFQDNGVGINLNKDGQHLFGLYQTFHNKKDVDSRGVGLFFTKNQVESLGGEIQVESQVGKGTTFKIIL